ncbi:MAG: tetratricopeptide repeat protein [Ignavibacteria bacterium]|nr:tetratricopeptide repeat protein [Ignavibacteria bacterium]
MRRLIFLALILLFRLSFAQSAVEKFERGIRLYEEGFLSEAYQTLNSIKEDKSLSYESLAQIYFLLGEIKFRLNDFIEASLDLENYVIKFPYDRNYDLALLRLGEIYFNLGVYTNAEKFLLKLLENNRDSKYLGLGYYWLGEVYSIQNDFERAEKSFLTALELKSSNTRLDYTLFSLAFLYEKLKLFDKAEYYYERQIIDFPNSDLTPHALVRVAYAHFTNGNYNKAITRLSDPKIRTLSQQSLAEAYYILANSYYKIGRFYEAQVEFQNVVNRYPNSPMLRPAKYGLGWSLYQQNKFEQAHKIFKELSAGNDSLAERSLYWLGFISRNLENNNQAIKEFSDYISRYPSSEFTTKAKYQIGLIYYELKNFQDAERFLIEVLEDTLDEKTRASAALILGTISLERKNFRVAKSNYELAVSLISENDEDYSDALLGLGISNYYLNNFDAAVFIFNKILSRKNIREEDKVRFYFGETYFAQNQFNNAIREYDRVIKITNDEQLKELSTYGLIYCYFNTKNYSRVVQLAQQFLQNFTYSKYYNEVKLRLADSYYAQKNFAKASELYRDYFSDPSAKGNDYVSYQLAQALFRGGNLEGAIDELKRFLSLYPSSRYSDEVQYLIGWIRFKQGKYEVSIEEYKKLLQNFPNSPILPLALYSIGDAYFNLGKYDLAIFNYEQVLKNYPNSDFVIDAMNGIQYAYVSQGKIDQAAQVITDFVYSNPGNRHLDKLLIKKGDLYLNQRRFQEAIAAYREFISFFPNSSLVPLAYFSIAKSFVQLKSYDDALFNLSMIIRNYPNDELADDAMLETGNIYRILNRFDDAIQQFETLIRNYPNSNLIAESYYWLGKAYLEKGDITRAKFYFIDVSNKYKQSGFYSRALFDLGKIELNSRPDTALSYFRKVVELRNDEYGAESQYLIGEILYNKKRYQEAIAEYLKLRYAFAGHTDWLVKGLFRVGEIYELLKDNKKAREFYNEVAKIDSKGELGNQAKSKLRRLR